MKSYDALSILSLLVRLFDPGTGVSPREHLESSGLVRDGKVTLRGRWALRVIGEVLREPDPPELRYFRNEN